jgi:hypothetical protein
MIGRPRRNLINEQAPSDLLVYQYVVNSLAANFVIRIIMPAFTNCIGRSLNGAWHQIKKYKTKAKLQNPNKHQLLIRPANEMTIQAGKVILTQAG